LPCTRGRREQGEQRERSLFFFFFFERRTTERDKELARSTHQDEEIEEAS